MLRRAVLHDLVFRKEFEPAEDYDLWVRLASKTDLAVITPPLVRYRIHENSVSALKVAAMQSAVTKIHCAQIEQLGVSDTADFHAAVVGFEPITSIDLLDSLGRWLLQLRRANEERRIYDPEAFGRELCLRWTMIGERAWGLGLAGWNHWRGTAPSLAPSMACLRLLGRALRWELARRIRHS